MANASEEDTRRAVQYWGQLLKTGSIGPTPKLERLLSGIAECIGNTFGDSDSPDLTPTQLLQYYRSVNGNYDKLFTLESESLVIIYNKLRCLYSLQPDDDNDDFEAPSIPALKPAGWVKWSCVQLLLGPTEHAMFLQNALHRYDVRDSETGELFPKLLPRQLFPKEPHEMMVHWHHDAGKELEHDTQQEQVRHDSSRPILGRSRESERERKHDAAQYFSNPHFRDKDGKPTIVKRLSMMGTVALNFVKDVFDPDLFGGSPRKHSQKDQHTIYTSPEPVEQALATSSKREPKQQNKVFRRVQWDEESTGSEEEYDSRRQARLRRHRSHEPVSSPREYSQASPQSSYKNRPRMTPNVNGVRNEARTPLFSPRHIAGHKDNTQTGKGPSQSTQDGYFDIQRPAVPGPAQGLSTQRIDKEEELLNTDLEIGLARPPQQPSASEYHSGPPPPRPPPPKARPEMRRVATPVKGVHGRVYPNEAGAFWRRK